MAPGTNADARRRAADAASDAPGSTHVVVERPPPGLARGRYAWPPWAVLLLGTFAVIAGLGYLAWRLRGRGKA